MRYRRFWGRTTSLPIQQRLDGFLPVADVGLQKWVYIHS
jgi:hypothetical protein